INCTSSTLEKRAKKIASKVRASFNNDIKGVYHQSDEIVLKSVEFSVNKLDFQLDYEEVLQPIIKDIQELGHGYELEINNQRVWVIGELDIITYY
ncbi:2208_t:CDS:2, partial [Rhizophagus irregularis]